MKSVFTNLLILIGLLVIASLGYYLYSNDVFTEVRQNEQNFQVEARSADFVRRLDELKQIKINTDLFADPRFTSLQDFSTEVPVLPVGRENPFENEN